MKIVCCAGGLGNQMFQYAFYRYLWEKGFKPYFDTSSKQLYRHTGFELQRIFPNIRIENKTTAPYLVRSIKHSIFALCWNNHFRFVGKDSEIDIKGRRFYESVFCGYWQQHGYVGDIRAQILKDFEFVPFEYGKNIETAKHISKTNSVSIHMRRGDYLKPENLKTLGSICTLDYYVRAIEFIRTRIENPEFVVFSDDMVWAKENFPLGKVLFVDWNTGKNSFRDMQLMSVCRHNIIANSTFSWWAAWLNKNDEKIVITPAKWSNTAIGGNYLALGQWIKL
ncbi:MAG: alpha-1,2-fucosyltransferase [Prevotellaceae bacterium]|jgi:hypothetical protein|nr:alpha-1,2-fucosyltransferase [Prevotellaceae bacterium]